MKTVIIMRGISGAGKSTYIREFYKEGKIVSADKFFLDKVDGTYHFDPKKLSEAHAECLRDFTNYVSNPFFCVGNSDSLVVVDNTNTTAVEIAPYMAIAKAYGWNVKIITIMGKPETCVSRNVHGVNMDTIKRQHERLVREGLNFPKHWAHIVVDRESK